MSVDCIKNDEPHLNVEPPGNFFERSHSNIRKEMNALLASRIPEEERIGRFGDAYLKKWFASGNLEQHFMYRSKTSLAAIAASCFTADFLVSCFPVTFVPSCTIIISPLLL